MIETKATWRSSVDGDRILDILWIWAVIVPMKKCSKCPKPATLHITELVKQVPHEVHLCEECAHQYLNQEDSTPEADTEAGMMIKLQLDSSDKQLAELDKNACPNCGITFREFRSQGRLGCPHDYVVFGDELEALLENIHDKTQHCGKVPKRAPSDSQKQYQLIKLRNDLRQAVAEESYEEAARIRDEIQAKEAALAESVREVE